MQGPGQALNLKDNNINVIVGQRKGTASWNKAVADGWKEGKTLFDVEEACKKGTIIMNLLSDAGQIQAWENMKKHLTKDKALYFSHGFGVTFHEKTGIKTPEKAINPEKLSKELLIAIESRLMFWAAPIDREVINETYQIKQDYQNKFRGLLQ